MQNEILDNISIYSMYQQDQFGNIVNNPTRSKVGYFDNIKYQTIVDINLNRNPELLNKKILKVELHIFVFRTISGNVYSFVKDELTFEFDKIIAPLEEVTTTRALSMEYKTDITRYMINDSNILSVGFSGLNNSYAYLNSIYTTPKPFLMITYEDDDLDNLKDDYFTYDFNNDISFNINTYSSNYIVNNLLYEEKEDCFKSCLKLQYNSYYRNDVFFLKGIKINLLSYLLFDGVEYIFIDSNFIAHRFSYNSLYDGCCHYLEITDNEYIVNDEEISFHFDDEMKLNYVLDKKLNQIIVRVVYDNERIQYIDTINVRYNFTYNSNNITINIDNSSIILNITNNKLDSISKMNNIVNYTFNSNNLIEEINYQNKKLYFEYSASKKLKELKDSIYLNNEYKIINKYFFIYSLNKLEIKDKSNNIKTFVFNNERKLIKFGDSKNGEFISSNKIIYRYKNKEDFNYNGNAYYKFLFNNSESFVLSPSTFVSNKTSDINLLENPHCDNLLFFEYDNILSYDANSIFKVDILNRNSILIDSYTISLNDIKKGFEIIKLSAYPRFIRFSLTNNYGKIYIKNVQLLTTPVVSKGIYVNVNTNQSMISFNDTDIYYKLPDRYNLYYGEETWFQYVNMTFEDIMMNIKSSLVSMIFNSYYDDFKNIIYDCEYIKIELCGMLYDLKNLKFSEITTYLGVNNVHTIEAISENNELYLVERNISFTLKDDNSYKKIENIKKYKVIDNRLLFVEESGPEYRNGYIYDNLDRLIKIIYYYEDNMIYEKEIAYSNNFIVSTIDSNNNSNNYIYNNKLLEQMNINQRIVNYEYNNKDLLIKKRFVDDSNINYIDNNISYNSYDIINGFNVNGSNEYNIVDNEYDYLEYKINNHPLIKKEYEQNTNYSKVTYTYPSLEKLEIKNNLSANNSELYYNNVLIATINYDNYNKVTSINNHNVDINITYSYDSYGLLASSRQMSGLDIHLNDIYNYYLYNPNTKKLVTRYFINTTVDDIGERAISTNIIYENDSERVGRVEKIYNSIALVRGFGLNMLG